MNMKAFTLAARNRALSGAMLGAIVGASSLNAAGVDVRVTIENLAPPAGIYFTPVWVGFHDGTFDLFDSGAPASAALERVAEDGDTGPLSGDFAASGVGSVDATIVSGGVMPQFGPGQSASVTFSLDPGMSTSRYFSFASMIIPSNDAFIANGNPLGYQIFDGAGTFLGADFVVPGSMVWDAGSEVNDEVPANTAFFGQAAPNTGVSQAGVVAPHPGFLAAGSGGILDDPMFASADFTPPGYQVARITVSQVPEPSTWTAAAVLAGLAGWVGRRARCAR